MSIATAITAAQGRVADAYTAISNKGGTLPATQNLTNMPTAINSISSADTVTATNNSSSAVTSGDKVWIEQVNEPANFVISDKTTTGIMDRRYNEPAFGSKYIGLATSINDSSYPYSKLGGKPFTISNDLNTITVSSPSFHNNTSHNDNGLVGEYRTAGCSTSNYFDLFDGTNVISLQNYKPSWSAKDVYKSNGNFVIYHRSNYSEFRIIDIDNETYTDFTGSSVSSSKGVYDKNTNRLYLTSNGLCYVTFSGNSYSVTSMTGTGLGYASEIAITSDGKYIIGLQFYTSDPANITSYYSLEILKIEGTTYTLVNDNIFGSWLTTGCDVFYNSNCDVLICTDRKTGNYGFFKYTPATETWAEISVDLSSIGTFSNFQCPIQVNNDNNMLMLKVGFSSGDYRTNDGNIYFAKYTASEGGLVWKINDFYSDNKNYNVVGSPTINDTTGAVSNFSSSNYLQIPVQFNPSNNPWEYVAKYNITTNSTAQFFIGSKKYYNCFVIGVMPSGYLGLWLSSNGSTWDICSDEGTYSVTPPVNTDFYVKLVFSGSDYTLSMSLDGSSWTPAAYVSSSTAIHPDLLYIGSAWEFAEYVRGTAYLKDTYIKINNNIVWIPYLPNITQDTFTGVAQENIAIGSSGDVKTVLE